MQTSSLSLLVSLYIIMSSASVYSQTESKSRHLYINPKAGIYRYDDGEVGFAWMLEAGKIKKRSMFSLSYMRGYQLFGNQLTKSFDVLYGRIIDEGKFRFECAAGLGTIWNEYKRPEVAQAKHYFQTIGIPLKLGMKVFADDFFTIGLDLQANINAERVTSMPMISLELGGLK
jgi:hypothetical protein